MEEIYSTCIVQGFSNVSKDIVWTVAFARKYFLDPYYDGIFIQEENGEFVYDLLEEIVFNDDLSMVTISSGDCLMWSLEGDCLLYWLVCGEWS